MGNPAEQNVSSASLNQSIEAITADPLKTLPGVSHAFFSRRGGASKGVYGGLNTGLGSNDNRQTVRENRRRAAEYLGVGHNQLATPYQVHSSHAVIASPMWGETDKPEADAVVTDQAGLAVGVGTADCGPVLFADGEAGVVAAAHAGWKGAANGILESTVDLMEELGAKRERISAVLGPTISLANYETGPEFRDQFLSMNPNNERFFSNVKENGHAHFDLPNYIVSRLRALGLGTALSIEECTYSQEDRFYSYRRATHRGEHDYGRLLSAIALKEQD